jgi:hypothetical protein
MRNLGCVDWFRKGQSSIYDIDDNGQVIVRGYGADTSWVPLPKDGSNDGIHRKFAFLPPTISMTYVRQDYTLMCIAGKLAEELSDSSKKLVFNGRASKTSNSGEHYTNALATKVQLMPHQYKNANFYCSSQTTKLVKLKSMKVLGSGEHPKLLEDCNELQGYVGGSAMIDHLHRILKPQVAQHMFAACYHMGTDDSTKQITYYPGHLDKAFVSSVWLIPLGVAFFTFVSFPTAVHYQQDEESLASYNNWVGTLSVIERTKLHEFENAFQEDAKIPMKNIDCQVYIFENKIGSLLSFPSNICYHTTVTPQSNVPRDLLIIHPLVGDSG